MIQHRLIYSIIDTATSIEKVHEEIAELDVTKRNSIGDRDALRLLYGVIKEQLVPGGGSTASELAAMEVHADRAHRIMAGVATPEDYEPSDQPL